MAQKSNTSKSNSNFVRRITRYYRRFRLFGSILVMISYAFLGGLLFSTLEKQNEIDMIMAKKENLNISALNLSYSIMAITNDAKITEEMKLFEIMNVIKEYQRQEGLVPKDKLSWTFLGGTFFAGTVFTTIGYGNVHPFTTTGRIAVMVYAIFGIPMTLIILKDIGKYLSETLNKFWFRLKLSLATNFYENNISGIIVGDVTPENTKFPITLAICIGFSWTLICAGVFCIWETSWSYFDAFYFFFISLSTIGFGDVMPEHPEYMICNPLVIIGLGLLSMIIRLIQERLEKLKENTTEYIESRYVLNDEVKVERCNENDNKVYNERWTK